MTPTPTPDSSESLLERIGTSLEDDKAEDVLVIDLRERSSIADYLILASGRSTRQLGAMAEHIATKLKTTGRPTSVEGLSACDWVLIDAGDVIVHLFRPEIRDHYGLERMWGVRRAAPEAPRFGPV
ncbi:MAG: ribosome silencing factor [Alphaproteobacteria bacterium]